MLTDERYKQLMVDVGMPNSRSLLQALQQCAREAIALHVYNSSTTDETMQKLPKGPTMNDHNETFFNGCTINVYDTGDGTFWCFNIYHENGNLIGECYDGHETKESALHDARNFARWCVV